MSETAADSNTSEESLPPPEDSSTSDSSSTDSTSSTSSSQPQAPTAVPVSKLRLEGPSDAAAPGTQVSLKWSFEGDAAAATIDLGVGDLDVSAGGSGTASYGIPQDAQDGSTITFTLTVTPKDGSDAQTATADVQVKAAVQPSVDEFNGALKEDDGLQHLPDSLQVVLETPLVLSWTVSNALDGVELKGPDGPQTFDAGVTSTEVTPTQETQDYELVAIAGQTRSQPKTVHVSTHPHGHLYSPHAHVLPPGAPAKIEKFVAYASDGGTLDAATDTVSVGAGGKVKLHVEVSGEADSIAIDNGASDVSLDDEGTGEIEVTPQIDKDAGELVYTLTVKPSNPSEDPQTATVHVKLQNAAVSATLQLIAGGQASADAAAAADEVKVVAGEAITLKWKVTSAASAQLTADLLPGQLVAEGVIGDDGELLLDVTLDKSVAVSLKMTDDDGNDVEWEFNLDVPEKPADTAAGTPADTPPANFDSLVPVTLNLKLDDSGNGEGEVVLDPGPGQSAVFTLTAKPKDEQQGTQGAHVTARISQNLSVQLLMPDGNPAPAGKTCKLTPILPAENDAGASQAGAA